MALALGLRRGEALGLRWADVDLVKGRLTVAASLSRVAGKLERAETKTNSSRRVLDLPAMAVRALAGHRESQLREQAAAGDAWSESGLVFVNRRGGPLEPRNINRSLNVLVKRAGLPPLRVHDLRHTSASLLLAQGVPLKLVQETLGHSGISITADIYAHITAPLRREVADAMDTALGPRKACPEE